MKTLFEGIGAKHSSNLSHWAYLLMVLIKVRGRLRKDILDAEKINCAQEKRGKDRKIYCTIL